MDLFLFSVQEVDLYGTKTNAKRLTMLSFFYPTRPFRGRAFIYTLPVLLLFISLIWWSNRPTPKSIAVIAKGSYTSVASAVTFSGDEAIARNILLADPTISRLLANKRYDFLYAVPLGAGESAAWRTAGCGPTNCSHVTLYNYSDGGTFELILNRETARIITYWQDLGARPGASRTIIPKALHIAAADKRVQTILGDIGAVEMIMAPMAAWLTDDDCNRDWCVDLTFAAPDGSGRIVHIFINMHQERVARIFSTRSRPTNQLYNQQDPIGTGNLFDNGCHEQAGWNVCWEMTAHDGVNFYNATFNELPVFSSIKIAQVEVWYPAWPGGYRDEIGFASSVPPKFGTTVRPVDDGFEVHQLFTEPFDWPNCICCYRYEQIVRFNTDGSFEPRFISQGPGCDDLSIYRPFWRIDLDGPTPNENQLWEWQNNQWVEKNQEGEFSLFTPLSLEGSRLALQSGDLFYELRPIPTDPLKLDDGLLFALKWNDGEGNNPIMPGAADTYEPPRQWIDGESLRNQNIVFWYIPFLKTKKAGIWWCMPEPAPDVTPCEGILHIVPTQELHQPTAEELAQLTPTPTPTAEPASSPTPAPTSTLSPIRGETAADIFHNAGCGTCHLAGDMGESRKVGPDLSLIGAEAGERVPGLNAEAYIRQAILQPNAHLVADCPNGPCLPNIMPDYYGERLSPTQIDTLVRFLLTLGVEGEPEAEPPATLGENGNGSGDNENEAEQITSGEDAAAISLLPFVLGGVVLLGAAAFWWRHRNQSIPAEDPDGSNSLEEN